MVGVVLYVISSYTAEDVDQGDPGWGLAFGL
jgi:hypothetical protein